MLIADAQVHTWTAGTPPYVHRQAPFTNDDLLNEMDAAGVDRAVLVPPLWDPTALAHAEAGARRHPDRFAVMGSLPLEEKDGRTLIGRWNRPGLLGLRLTFGTPERLGMLRNGAVEWLWAEAEKSGIPIMLAIWGKLAEAIPIVERHPGLRLIIDHLGVPVTERTMDDDAFSDMAAVLALSRFANVAIKASGLPAHSTQPYPYPNLHGYLRQAFDAFGPERTFWGTDLTRVPCTYRECVTLFTEELPWLSEADKELVMGTALCRWIGWELPAAYASR
jgi:predicted TIM-barrel fold metal-dependent hydrolase